MSVVDTIADEINLRLPVPLAQDKWKRDNNALATRVHRYRQYVDGAQDSGLNEQMRKMLNLQADQSFNFNRCPEVVETLANRLNVTGIRPIIADGTPDALDEWISELRDWNYFDALQLDIHDASLRDGDAFIMVDWDEEAGQITLTSEYAYDGVSGVLVIHDPRDPTVLEVAAKVWTEALSKTEDMTRVNLYFPDRVVKLIVKSGAVAPFIDEDNPAEDGVYPWVDAQGGPLGVPVVQFPARGFGTTGHGKSKLKDVVPLQHGLNATIHSMVGVDFLSAFPINIMIGWSAPEAVQPGMFYDIYPKDGEGKVSRPSPELVEWLKAIRVHTIPGANLSPFIETIKFFENAMDQAGNIPNYRGLNESGEALKQREASLLGEIRRCHVAFGNAWGRVFATALTLANTMGAANLPEPKRWQIDWQTGETRNRVDQAAVLTSVAPFLEGTDEPIRQAGQILDLPAERIEELIEQKEEAKTANMRTLLETVLPGTPRSGAMDETFTAPATQQRQPNAAAPLEPVNPDGVPVVG